jgi:hypothetical protein
MSPARRNAYRTAADKYISGIDPTQQGYNAVTKKGGYGYDDAYINYAPPSGDGDSSGGGSGSKFWNGFDSRSSNFIIMARKSALEKIEYHEKICRIMQRQTFEQIQQLKNQIIRIERILIGTAAFVIISLLEKII